MVRRILFIINRQKLTNLKTGIENKNFAKSLRSGFATAADSGADERSIMAMTGHKTTQIFIK